MKSAAPFVPEELTLPVLREAVERCQGCDRYKHATQAVFGELEASAEAKAPKVSIMMIGDQPGDQEDRAVPLSGLLKAERLHSLSDQALEANSHDFH